MKQVLLLKRAVMGQRLLQQRALQMRAMKELQRTHLRFQMLLQIQLHLMTARKQKRQTKSQIRKNLLTNLQLLILRTLPQTGTLIIPRLMFGILEPRILEATTITDWMQLQSTAFIQQRLGQRVLILHLSQLIMETLFLRMADILQLTDLELPILHLLTMMRSLSRIVMEMFIPDISIPIKVQQMLFMQLLNVRQTTPLLHMQQVTEQILKFILETWKMLLMTPFLFIRMVEVQ